MANFTVTGNVVTICNRPQKFSKFSVKYYIKVFSRWIMLNIQKAAGYVVVVVSKIWISADRGCEAAVIRGWWPPGPGFRSIGASRPRPPCRSRGLFSPGSGTATVSIIMFTGQLRPTLVKAASVRGERGELSDTCDTLGPSVSLSLSRVAVEGYFLVVTRGS